MITPIEAVWNQMKASAADYAMRGEHLTRDQAEATVARMLHEARVSPWPPQSVVEFYACELVDMLESGLRKNTSARRVS
jgi:hypothetical protein